MYYPLYIFPSPEPVWQLSGHFGQFESPGYPSYQNNVECDILVSVDPGLKVQISFEVFDLEYGGSCEYDSLQVSSGVR